MDGRLPTNAPAIPSDFEVQVAFTNLTFQNPMGVVPVPGSNRLAVWEREGAVWTFQNDPAASEKKLMLDLSIQCQGWGASGLFSLAFHPGFTTNGWVFVYYTWVQPGTVRGDMVTESPEMSAQNYRDRLSRFTLVGEEVPSLDSEVVLVDQITDSTYHSGGSIFFHPNNGFLYWCNGDDYRAPTQLINENLLSGVFRIDADQRGGNISHPIRRQPNDRTTANYFIPNDNPFVDVQNALEEFYSLGLRNPYRMSIDPATLRIFIGDVGNFSREELNTIEPSDPAGLNFQWGHVEGAGGALTAPYAGVSKGPLLDYSRADGGCIIGGHVYRGTEFAQELGGRYIFGDNSSSAIWVLDESTLPPGKIQLASFPQGPGPAPHGQYLGLSSFGLDQNGELLMCQLSTTGGRIYKLTKRGPSLPRQRFPELLSETGVFENTTAMSPATNLIPYEVNSPLWSDGADKIRWFTIPKNTTIGFSASGEWQFPAGSVFVKHFEMPNAGLNGATQRLETRLLVRGAEGGVFGATYKWRSDNSDADLLDGPLDEQITIPTAEGLSSQVWHYPSRTECLQCHTASTKGVLALNTRQINRDYSFSDGATENQLKAFSDIRLFFPSISETNLSSFARLAHVTNSSASLESRARSYLDSNCSHCHRPGEGRSYWDGRFETPLQLAGILNGTIAQSFNIEGAKTLVPNHPEKSIILHRAASLAPSVKMPPIGKNRIDTEAIAVLSEYIRSLPESDNALPGGWSTLDIGPALKPGSATYSSDALSITASNGDIWSSSDTFTFAHQQLVGDGTISARIASSSGSESARIGVMIRSSLDADSSHAYMSLLNRRGLFFCYRSTTAGMTAAFSRSGITAPIWVRIERKGNVFSGYFKSEKGMPWTSLGSVTISMPERAYVGFAATGAITTGNFVVDEIETVNVPPLNQRPTISLSPQIAGPGAVAGPILLRASAEDADGNPAMVEFFDGSTRVGQATAPPFELLVNAAAGIKQFSARVYDDYGAIAWSPTNELSVEPIELHLTSRPSSDAPLEFFHFGNPGILYLSEGSHDLANWLPVSTNNAAAEGKVSFSLPNESALRFFRVRPK